MALAGPPVFVVVTDRLFGTIPGLMTQVLLQLVYVALAGLLLLAIVGVEQLPLTSIGWRRPDAATLVSAAAVVAVSLYLLPIVTAPLVRLAGSEGLDAGIARLSAMPPWFLVVVGATGGAVEELCYRGYAIERLAAITGRRWLAGVLAVLAFALAHIPAWGVPFALAADLPFGILMTIFYLWRRDLPANMLAHASVLVVQLLTAVP